MLTISLFSFCSSATSLAENVFSPQKFYRSESAAELCEQERTHVCRFHTKQLLQTSRQIQTPTLTSKRAHYTVSNSHLIKYSEISVYADDDFDFILI